MFESLVCWDELPPLPECPPDHDAPLSDAELVAAVSESWREPSAELVSLLASVSARGLSADAALEVLAGWDRVRSWVDGQCYQVLGVIADADDSPEEWCREQVAAVLGLAPITAHDRLRVARALAHDLPGTCRLLLAGALSARHAVAVADAADQLPAGSGAVLEAAVLGRAVTQTVPELRRSLARAVLRLDPAGARQRAAAAHRSVSSFLCKPVGGG